MWSNDIMCCIGHWIQVEVFQTFPIRKQLIKLEILTEHLDRFIDKLGNIKLNQ